MTDYTPTTESIMAAYIADGGWTAEDRAAQFDRWHADEIRKAKTEAWEEGHSWGWSDAQEAHDVRQHMDRAEWPLRTPNPYTEDQ